jgi:hypothetical protein
MNQIFDLCVNLLLWLAALFGTTYKAINVWIFCILWPLATLALVVMVVIQRRWIQKIKTEEKQIG